MSLTEQVFVQARFMAQDLTAENQALLEMLCKAAVASLTAKLRDEITPEDCLSEFVAAASMYALAALSDAGEREHVEQLTAGDLTVRRSTNDAAANCLRAQASIMMAPYTKAPAVFLGV